MRRVKVLVIATNKQGDMMEKLLSISGKDTVENTEQFAVISAAREIQQTDFQLVDVTLQMYSNEEVLDTSSLTPSEHCICGSCFDITPKVKALIADNDTNFQSFVNSIR